MFRLIKSSGGVSLLSALLFSALLMGGCPEKYKPATDAGPDASGPENTAAACSDGVDNDGDGDTDCADSECAGFDVCVETDCSDGIDNDGDGLADCLDTDCQSTIDCRENTAAACQDNIDNDGDGDTDCDDTDCSTMLNCTVESDCDDNVDNDNDGDTDCDDTDCASAAVCGGFCYSMDFQAPGVWGMAITEANDDLDAGTACVQYDVVVQATSPEANTQICLYLDDLNSAAAGCADPNSQNPMTFRVDLCAGTHTLYARVEQGANVCLVPNLGLEQIQVEVYENPSCTITAPAGLSTDSGNPTCVNQADMDILVTTSGADAQLWIAGALTATEDAVSGIVDFSGTALGSDADKTINALCDNPGDGNGSTWSPDYYTTLDTTPPAIQIVSPSTGATYGAAECPFEVVVTGVEAGQEVCAHYTGQTPPAAACATSTSTSDQHTLTVQCVDGVDLTLEANTQDTCGNSGQATILVTADTGLPSVLIESPVNAQTYNKADDTLDPATDAFELEITACTDQAYNPGNVTLVVDGLTITTVTPTIQAAACGVLSHRITWSPVFPFAQSSSGLQTVHTVSVEVSDGFNTAQAAATFRNDTIAPQVTFSCSLCRPNKSFFTPLDDNCVGVPFEAEARAQVSGLEVGQMINLLVTASGVPVGASPYGVASVSTGEYVVTFNSPCGAELQNGQNQLQVVASDTAGNPAVPAVKVVTYGDGFIASPVEAQVLGAADDCDGGAAYGIPVTVQIDHGSVANGTAIEVAVSSLTGGWSLPAAGTDVWPKSCTGDPCTHTFCVPVSALVEQSDITAELLISSTAVPGGPSSIAVDLSPPGQAMNPTRTVVNRRAAEIQLDWDSVEDAQSGLLQEWDVRCVANGTISAANWATAMQFTGEPTPAANGIAQTMNVAEDVNGMKIRAGSDYSCGIRGLNQASLWSDVSIFPQIDAADIDFVPYSLVIEGYTGFSDLNRFANIVGVGDVNGDSYDDMIVGYGHSGGHKVAIYFGSATGPSATNKLEITCADPSFGAAIAGIGDFDGEPYSVGDTGLYPDFVISAPEEERVYLFRGHSGLLGPGTMDCSGADLKVVHPVGEELGGVLAPIGDFDNDGLNDFAIGSSSIDSWTGAVFVVFGRANLGGDINLLSGANADGALHFSPGNADAAGSGITGADLNQDGFMDLVFGSHTGGASNKGSLSVLLGYSAVKTPNTVTMLGDADIDQVVFFVPSGWLLPEFSVPSVVSMDFNNDGCIDVVVGIGRHTVGGELATGAVQVFSGVKAGGLCTGAISSVVNVSINSQTAWDQFGGRIAPGYNLAANVPVPTRVNGVLASPSDAVIFTGARQHDVFTPASTGSGYVGLWYAGFTSDLTSAQSDLDFAAPGGSIGWHIASFVGDLNGDGYTDLAIGDSDFAPLGRIYLYQ
jgi:FG-GAP repeat